MKAQRKNGQAHQAGVSLVEVLVSVLILSIGLLGIAAMQATALRNGQSSLERSQAVVQTYSILDAIRADRDNIALYDTGGERCAAATAPTGASSQQVAANDVLNDWVASLKNALGAPGDSSSCGRVACAAGVCTVTVRWDDSRGTARGGSNAAGSSTRQAVTVAQI